MVQVMLPLEMLMVAQVVRVAVAQTVLHQVQRIKAILVAQLVTVMVVQDQPQVLVVAQVAVRVRLEYLKMVEMV
jgi:hypothetical protein